MKAIYPETSLGSFWIRSTLPSFLPSYSTTTTCMAEPGWDQRTQTNLAVAREKYHWKHQPAAEGSCSDNFPNLSRRDFRSLTGCIIYAYDPLCQANPDLTKIKSVGMSCWAVSHMCHPPFTHGWLYNHLQLIVTSRNMLVWVVIAIWISVQGLWTVAHNGQSETWVIDMLFFTFLLILVPSWRFPTLPAHFRPHLALGNEKIFKTQKVLLTTGVGVVSRRLLASNCLFVRDLETPLRSCHLEVFVREPKPCRQLPQMSVPWQCSGLNTILIATNSLGCGTAANGSLLYRQVSTVM